MDGCIDEVGNVVMVDVMQMAVSSRFGEEQRWFMGWFRRLPQR